MNGLNSCNTTNPFKIKHPTPLERTYSANLILYIDHIDGVYIAKNRYGPTGNVNTECLIDILSHILAERVFDGRMVMFQEGMKRKLIKAMTKIIEKG